MNLPQLKKLILDTLEEHKAADISTFDVRKITDISDYLIICSATSSRHIKALADHVIEQVKKQNIKPIGYEGRKGEHGWALVDLGDIIVHIMVPEIREFYNLEKLWDVAKPVASSIKPKKTKEKKIIMSKAKAKKSEKTSKKPAVKKTVAKKVVVKKDIVKTVAIKKPAIKKVSPKKPAVKKDDKSVKKVAIKKPAVKTTDKVTSTKAAVKKAPAPKATTVKPSAPKKKAPATKAKSAPKKAVKTLKNKK